MKKNRTLRIFDSLSVYPFGQWLFSLIVCRTAPYFGSVKPLIKVLKVNYCECLIKKRRRVQNHIKTVHVIAICNGLEMAMGVMAEASVPPHLRWIPKGMEVEYVAKANSDILCIAEMSADGWKVGDSYVSVKGLDTSGKIVVEGRIKLWITEKK